ncbi:MULTISPECIES: SMP-30/gluconolactonase/LRE family protein [unclassified Endozoicomonas]|uniref:SMP-30/gluconolactonase/LRE family protein n=1 Tax=unclassified Endozoicomonas TaxID=2644528 RepID=UPI00214848BB|nr:MULTISPECIES: SMP-30/gluconolactonase/LRE family protein [unclassified Endozoicomonas]
MKIVKNVLDAGTLLGECPRWHEPTSTLYWVDITGKSLNSWQPESGARQSLSLPEEIGCFVFRASHGLVAALRSGFVFLDSIESGRITPICDPESDKPHNRLNDGRCDALGRFWVGSVYPPKDKSDAWIYMLNNQLDCQRKAGPFLTSNGIAFSPDNRTIYYADSPEQIIYACDFDLERAELSNRRVFHRFPAGKGRPDGCAVDEEGCYWTALFAGGAVVRLSPGGVLLETISLPVKYPTMVAFGGDDYSTLYITSCRQACSDEELELYPESGSIFAVKTGVRGLKENRFAV